MMLKFVGGVCLATVTMIAPARAQTDNDLANCAKIEIDQERLACFDSLVTTSTRTYEERRAAVQSRAREDFGLSESQKDEKYADDAERVSEGDITIVSTITSVTEVAYGPTYVTLANGQQWRTPSSGGFTRPPKPGMEVTIRKGGLDGYRLAISGRSGAVPVRRVK